MSATQALRHHVTIRRTSHLSVPHKWRTSWWRGQCTCGWGCWSWEWIRPDGTGTLPTAVLVRAFRVAVPSLLDALDRAEAALDRARQLVVWTDPARLGGTPCVRGTRTPVDHITELLDDFSDEEITGYYPAPEVWQVALLRTIASTLERKIGDRT